MGCLIENEQNFVNDITNNKLTSRYILSTLKDRNKDNLICVTQIYKQESVSRSNVKAPRIEMQQLIKLIEDEKYVSKNRRREDFDVVKDIF